MAELVVQAHAAEATSTRFSMVRFGNVLGSSGSVVPLFRRRSLPVDRSPSPPEIIRYFMTIPEVATLVLQSSCSPKAGMCSCSTAEPVRIKALAEQMVRLSGLSLRDGAHPDGDIEIVCTGLRPGEKLYEEPESLPTPHPLIYRAEERSIPLNFGLNWRPCSRRLRRTIGRLRSSLAELVPEWRRVATGWRRGEG